MAAVVYYIALPFIYLLSLLPFPVLYLLSDFVFFLIYYVVGYRRKVVMTNLKNSFPGYSQKKLNNISKDYYKYLCDMMLETFKTLTISKESMLEHCYMSKEARSLFDNLAHENKSIIMVLGHLGNWEWAGNTFSLCCKHQLFVIYHPLSNKKFDGLMHSMRSRFGTKLIDMKYAYKEMLLNKSNLNSTAFIADQAPSYTNTYWTTFLNQDTPVFKGTEVIAKKMGLPVVYVFVEKIKRGVYEMHAEILEPNPKNTTDGQLTEMHTRRLEKDIIYQPTTWLWTHRRWKRKRPVE